VTLPNVTTGTRTVTLDAARNFRTLAINQSTAGATNRLLFNANLTSDSNTDLLPTLNATAGTIVIDKGSYNFLFTSGGSVRNLILGPNVILNSSGGQMQDAWQTDKSSITLQGTANFITAATAMGDNGNKFTVDTTGVLNLTSGGGVSLASSFATAGTLTLKGTIAGDSSGSINARTVQLMAGSTISGIPTISGVANFDLRATDHTAINLSGTTLSTWNSSGGGLRNIEVGSNLSGRFLINKLTVNSGAGANRTMLVDNYNNDQDSAAAEHLEVNTLEWAGSNFSELDLNGLDVKVNTALTVNPYQRQLSNRKAGSTSTLTLGGTLDLGSRMQNNASGDLSMFVQNGATLDIVQSVPLSGLNVAAGSGTIKIHSNAAASATDGGIHDMAGNLNAWAASDALTVDLSGNTLTLNNGADVRVTNGAALVISGSLVNNSGDTGNGVMAIGSGTRITVSGAYSSDSRGRLQIDSGATVKIGGNFLPTAWWGGLYSDASRFWQVDTTATPGVFTLNGGGPTQDFEVLSKDYAVSGGALERLYNSTVSRLPFGTLNVGDPLGTAASVRLVNLSHNNTAGGPNQDTQVARSLTVTTNSVFDIAQFKMVVAIGTNSTVAGLITNSVAGGTLVVTNGAALKFATGGVIDVDTMTIASDCKVDFNQVNQTMGSYIRVNGDQKVAFDALIAGGQIVDNGGGVVKTSYSAGDAHTTVYLAPPPSGSVLIIE
jgi:hypothetical protein